MQKIILKKDNKIVEEEKMELISTYIETKNFEKSVDFYKAILNIEPKVYCENRWIEFECGNKIAIYNKQFDIQKINENKNLNKNYNQAYIKNFEKVESEKKNNIITLNFYTSDLKQEYKRIKELNITEISEIMYVNIVEPYYYFNVTDPDGNTLEICSENY